MAVQPRLPQPGCENYAARTRRRVAVLNTGGTIGMKPNAAGALEPCPGYLAERMLGMQELARDDMPAVDLYELLPLLDSSDMGPDDWLRIGAEIEARYAEYDAFVVIMGTDTMSYAASALSFVLENLGKSVIVTGSMLPLADVINDAQRNLTVSLVLAAALNVPEVCIFINERLLRGNRTVKVNSGGLDAFESPNFPPLALLETGIRFKLGAVLPAPAAPLTLHTRLESNIAVWRMVPGFDDEYITTAISHRVGLRAIVIELYGTGNLSSRKSSLLAALRDAIDRGIVVVAASQCLRGTVDLRAYALGAHLEALGVVPALDTTIEAIVTKLAYLLSWPDMSPQRVREIMARSLRGEVTEASDAASGPTSPRNDHAWLRGDAAGAAGTAALACNASGDVPPSSMREARASPTHGSGEVRLTMAQLSGMMLGAVAPAAPRNE